MYITLSTKKCKFFVGSHADRLLMAGGSLGRESGEEKPEAGRNPLPTVSGVGPESAGGTMAVTAAGFSAVSWAAFL